MSNTSENLKLVAALALVGILYILFPEEKKADPIEEKKQKMIKLLKK